MWYDRFRYVLLDHDITRVCDGESCAMCMYDTSKVGMTWSTSALSLTTNEPQNTAWEFVAVVLQSRYMRVQTRDQRHDM